MREIKIGFSAKKGFAPYSWAIKAYEQTPFSHTYVSINTRWSTKLIYQASGSMVNFMAGQVFYENNKIYKEFTFSISEESYNLFMQFATTECGRPYSMLQPLGLVFIDLFNLKKNPFSNSNKAWVCSELVSYVLADFVGVDISPHRFELATPLDLYKICRELKEHY